MIKKILFPLIILIIAIGVIFYQFPSLPKNLSYDEVQFAKLALSLDSKPYMPYSQLATGHSTLYFYIILLSFKIFGVTNFALRLPSAIFGALNPIIMYLIFNKIFKNSPFSLLPTLFPLLLSIIFATSHWYFNFARFSFEATFLLFLELIAVYYLLKSEDTYFSHLKSRPSDKRGEGMFFNAKNRVSSFLVLSGIFSGLAYNSYTPGRIFFLLPLFIIVYMSLRGIRQLAETKQSLGVRLLRFARNDILLFLIPFFIVILPLTIYLLQHPDPRVDKQFFLKNTELSLQQKGEYLTSNIVSTVLMFNIKGDVNGRHNYPYKSALNPILGILFLIGLIKAIQQFNNINNRIFLIYFILSLIPALLTYPWENPNMLRTVTVIPSVIYFIGLTIYELTTIVTKSSLTIKKLFWLSLISLLFISCVYEIRTYFLYQSRVFPEAFEIKLSLPQAMVKF